MMRYVMFSSLVDGLVDTGFSYLIPTTTIEAFVIALDVCAGRAKAQGYRVTVVELQEWPWTQRPLLDTALRNAFGAHQVPYVIAPALGPDTMEQLR